MILSIRRRRYLKRLTGYLTNPVARRVRTAAGREQHYSIAGRPVVLPPQHDLPFYQRRDPTYDTYAGAVIADLAAGVDRLLVIDIGANVGDTAVECLGSADNVDLVAVEGAEAFLPYLRRNVAQFGERCRVIGAFVGPVRGITDRGFTTGHSTGMFAREGVVGEPVDSFVSPAELLADADAYDTVVWKSDVDGLDIHLLVQHWDAIAGACDTLWFEYAPADTLGERSDAHQLATLLRDSGRRVDVYDNLGRKLLSLPPGAAVETALDSLTAWLHEQRHGHLLVPYVDLWAFRDGASHRATQ